MGESKKRRFTRRFLEVMFCNLFGAGDETQTRGLILGKDALYQLSYTRMCIFLTVKVHAQLIEQMYYFAAELRN